VEGPGSAEHGEVRSPSRPTRGIYGCSQPFDVVQCNVLDGEHDIGICDVAKLRYYQCCVAAHNECPYINVNALEILVRKLL